MYFIKSYTIKEFGHVKKKKINKSCVGRHKKWDRQETTSETQTWMDGQEKRDFLRTFREGTVMG